VWVDGNADGISQANELQSLTDAGIAKLNLNAAATSVNSNGNWVGLSSSFERVDGSSGEMADVWFANGMRDKVSGMAQAIGAFGSAAQQGDAGANKLDLPGSAGGTQVLAAANNMADLMKQFDATGGSSGMVGSTSNIKAPGLASDTSGNGFLAVPK